MTFGNSVATALKIFETAMETKDVVAPEGLQLHINLRHFTSVYGIVEVFPGMRCRNVTYSRASSGLYVLLLCGHLIFVSWPR